MARSSQLCLHWFTLCTLLSTLLLSFQPRFWIIFLAMRKALGIFGNCLIFVFALQYLPAFANSYAEQSPQSVQLDLALRHLDYSVSLVRAHVESHRCLAKRGATYS